MLIVAADEVEHNLQTDFLCMFATEPDGNFGRHAGLASPTRGEATVRVSNRHVVPSWFFLDPSYFQASSPRAFQTITRRTEGSEYVLYVTPHCEGPYLEVSTDTWTTATG